MYSGGNTVSALSHSQSDDCISPTERSRLYLIEEVADLLTIIEENLPTVQAYDPKNTSSAYHLAYSKSYQTLLDAVSTAKAPDIQEVKKSFTFPLYTVDQLFELEEPAWLVDKLIPRTGVGILYAGSRQLKSFASIGIAGAITNQATLGGYTVTENRRVAFGLLEGFSGFKNRIAAYRTIVDPSFDPLTINLSGFNLRDRDHRAAIIEHCLVHDIGFLTIDTYSKASMGVNENSSNETAEVITGAEEIANTVKCIVLLIDHTGKDTDRGVRGSSAKFANVDFVFAQKRYSDHITLTVEKQKDAEDGFEMHFDVATSDEMLAIDCSQQKCISVQQIIDQALADGEDENDLKARLEAEGGKSATIRSAIYRSKNRATKSAI
jgi:hypothetical protein